MAGAQARARGALQRRVVLAGRGWSMDRGRAAHEARARSVGRLVDRRLRPPSNSVRRARGGRGAREHMRGGRRGALMCHLMRREEEEEHEQHKE